VDSTWSTETKCMYQFFFNTHRLLKGP
jgi:hypothetical protein